MDKSFWEFMGAGGGAMWVVFGFSVIAFAVAIERAIAQWDFVARARSPLGTTARVSLARARYVDVCLSSVVCFRLRIIFLWSLSCRSSLS